MKWNKINISIAVLIIFHMVGIGGVLLANPIEFLRLTPLNLLLTLVIILINHQEWKFVWVFVVTYLVGFFVEVLGVNTGFPFGEYEYGSVLGPKVFETIGSFIPYFDAIFEKFDMLKKHETLVLLG